MECKQMFVITADEWDIGQEAVRVTEQARLMNIESSPQVISDITSPNFSWS